MRTMIRVIITALFLLSFLFCTGCGSSNVSDTSESESQETQAEPQPHWHSVPHSFSGQRFEGVFALDDNHVWAVSVNGTILFFNGTNWVAQMLDNGACLFYGVTALTPNCVWAAGDDGQNGIIYFSEGSAWNKQYEAKGARLQDIFALDSGHVWAVGQNGTILFFNGSSWSKQASNTTEFLTAIFALNSNNAWAVGDKGTILYFNGSVWNQQPIVTNGNLSGVAATDANHIWVGGNQGVMFYDGMSWQIDSAGGFIKDLDAADNKHVWGVGARGAIIFFNGVTWGTQDSGTTNTIADISVVDDSSAWAAGDYSTILRYSE